MDDEAEFGDDDDDDGNDDEKWLSKNLIGDRNEVVEFESAARRAASASEIKVSAAATRITSRLLRSEMEERQRNFLAATAKRRAEEKQETERLQRLRAAGITDTSEYRPSDWSAPVGADVQAVAELLTVRSAGVAPRCQR